MVIKKIFNFCGFFILLCALPAVCAAAQQNGNFSQFQVDLPARWTGEEQIGFISDNPDEYMLSLVRTDESGEKPVAHISIYLLPNRPGADAQRAAEILSEAQADASIPVQEGNFWSFEGVPRSEILNCRGTTWVNTSPETMLIIIAQDPEIGESTQIINSLRAITPEARQLLGR